MSDGFYLNNWRIVFNCLRGSGPSRCARARGHLEPVRARTARRACSKGPWARARRVRGAPRALNGHKASRSYSISDTPFGSF